MADSRRWAGIGALLVSAVVLACTAHVGQCDDRPSSTKARIEAIEKELQELKDQSAKGQDNSDIVKRLDALEKAITELKAQPASSSAKPAAAKPTWADSIKVSGYAQVRFGASDYGDKPSNKFFLRRVRPKIEAKINDRTGVELQLDTTEKGVQLIDAFGSYGLTENGDYTLYVGQRTVPFGFDTPRSSSRRLALERIEILRRMIPDERDLGAWVQYTPEAQRKLFNTMKKSYLGEGDYGMFTVGAYNGQGRNQSAQIANKHISARFAYPFMIGSRYAEAGASYFTGKFVWDTSGSKAAMDDNLKGVHFFLPTQPFGIEAEYYKGETGGQDLSGWGVQGAYKLDSANTVFVRRDIFKDGLMKKVDKTPDYAKVGDDFRRTTFGVARELDGNVRLTLEYDKQEKRLIKGGPFESDNRLSAQMMYRF